MMRFAILLVTAILIGIGADGAIAESASCSALIKKRDAECQVMAEKMEAACSGEKADSSGEQSGDCKRLGQELANHCNRNPCRTESKKSKAKKKAKDKAKKAKDKKSKPKESKAKPKPKAE
jgi:hypothetical protein